MGALCKLYSYFGENHLKRFSWVFVVIYMLSTTTPVTHAQNSSSSEKKMRKIPEDIRFGVATAAYQIEGAWNVADKTPSMWDTFCQKPSAIEDGTTGNDACKSYEYYQRDIQMIKFLNVDFYRFSISWPRLFPNGFTNKISEDGKRYYNDLINALLENGIEPIVTLYHWDLPQNFQDLGGWANPLIVEWFEDFARGCYELFGDRVKKWITINEPKQIAILGYGMKLFAPGIDSAGIGEYLAVKYLLLAHARAWHVYDKEFRDKQKGVCGITIATDYRVGATDAPEDKEAGQTAMEFEAGLYAHPIFSSEGNFPKKVIARVAERSKEQGFTRSRLPELSQEEIEYIKGTSDFYGFNHYSTQFFTPYKKGHYPIPSHGDDIGGVGSILDYPPAVMFHSTSIPHGIRKALNWVKENCNNPQIVITENGYATYDGLEDDERIDYFKKYLDNILDAKEIDGCNVVAYTAWSLMDNFEWSAGQRVKFGLFEVDYDSEERTRTAKSSAWWYKNLMETRVLDPNYKPNLSKSITF